MVLFISATSQDPIRVGDSVESQPEVMLYLVRDGIVNMFGVNQETLSIPFVLPVARWGRVYEKEASSVESQFLLVPVCSLGSWVHRCMSFVALLTLQ